MSQFVNVIGAGLAGSEAAWQIAKRGIKVNLYEMRPVKQTPAHHTDKFAELCMQQLTACECFDKCSRCIKGRNASFRFSHHRSSR
ncbi:hypothetical protein BsIDN1_29430 [Bacillus safensis]|uniref:MnmG N-terminal domain-containing protein n=1 Tax=Bacillus safensis TaxID=561879 RepID=A0A5S9M8Y8_BACIA|nr:hypothetical protein BsIDN1_29430 [Bacillus safensis]